MIVILAALAATRWATLLVQDEFGPIADLRAWILYRWPTSEEVFRESEVEVSPGEPRRFHNRAGVELFPSPTGGYLALNPHPVGTLVTCPRCMSVWSGLVAMLVLVFLPASVGFVVFAPFAFSQVAITLTE